MLTIVQNYNRLKEFVDRVEVLQVPISWFHHTKPFNISGTVVIVYQGMTHSSLTSEIGYLSSTIGQRGKKDLGSAFVWMRKSEYCQYMFRMG
jgi:hypothetical protein